MAPRTLTLLLVGVLTVVRGSAESSNARAEANHAHVWEMQEIPFETGGDYENPYVEVLCWIDLKGPGFEKRIYGFWDGGATFKVRFVATAPGEWTWESGSNQPGDDGLNGQRGTLQARDWSEQEKRDNPNRRGFVRATANGHALEYADGTPYFMVGDTWLAGSTWRLPFRNAATSPDYQPGPGIGFEDAVQYRKRQGFNSVSLIAAFPNWESDMNPSTYADENGIYLRNAWEKFHYDVADGVGTDASGGVSYWGTFTAKNMRDEVGNLPFAMSSDRPGVSDFDRLTPEYFQSLDRKMRYFADVGFVPLLETVRRDVGPSWNAYYDFNESFARYYQYLISRYGAYNLLFSGIHLDWVPQDFSLTAEQFNAALIYHRETYGPPPFGQLCTALIDRATHTTLGQGEQVPWLDMHSVGNKPRDHRVGENLEAQFAIKPPKPTINFEPYYTGWLHEINKPAGEEPPPNSARDVYFARAQMYGSVLSGGLSGHVHGTAAYDLTSTGEPAGARPHIWDALRYNSADHMAPLKAFVLSEGKRYQDLIPATNAIAPRQAPGAPEDGLDGWSYLMRTEDARFALLYFENGAVTATLSGFAPGGAYQWNWYNPRTGEWLDPRDLEVNGAGELTTPAFPDGESVAPEDWAAKILAR